MIHVHVADEQSALEIDHLRLISAVERILQDADIRQAEVSLAIVDDPTMHRLNREYLEHDYPTDVLSFLLDREGDRLEGEVIASTDTAIESAGRFGCAPRRRTIAVRYPRHAAPGGLRRLSPEPLAAMREAERAI